MTLEENKKTVRRYFEEFHNRRDMALAPDIAPEQVVETIRGIAAVLRTAFPDYQITITAMVVEKDTVATVWRGQGTHQEAWESPIGSIPATGKRVEWTATTTLRLIDGKIAETNSQAGSKEPPLFRQRERELPELARFMVWGYPHPIVSLAVAVLFCRRRVSSCGGQCHPEARGS